MKIISAWFVTNRGEEATSAFMPSVFEAVRFQTVSVWPQSKSLPAIAFPRCPSPINPKCIVFPSLIIYLESNDAFLLMPIIKNSNAVPTLTAGALYNVA
jgi:hypothetical protein